MVADWRIGDANDFDEAGVLHFSTGTDGHGEGFLHSLPKDRFIALSFGVIDLKSPSSNVRFKMGGGLDVIGSFGGFAGGLEFDALELRLVRPPWAAVRLLLLGAVAAKQLSDGDNSEPPCCQLAGLPADALRLIIRML